MAKKKQEIQLMRMIDSQEEWEDVMGKEGLWVVDVFQEWSGPCDAMVSNFRRIKNELGDDLLRFGMAKSDNIESLEKYRGSCEPCFLFFAAGVLVSFVHGANAPLILRTLTEQLAQEHKVQDGSAERKEVKDPFVANREAADDTQKDDEEEDDGSGVPHRRVSTYPQDYEEVEQGYTVAIIKPNVVSEGKVDDILAEMKARGIDVIAQEERQLSEDEAREFYSHLKDEEYFDDLVSFMASGPSHVLVLTKGQEDDSIIKDWRDLLGPPTVEDAKETAPESLRAKYGMAGLMNALHGSDSKETAARELGFFFPNMNAPTMQKKKKEIQRTLALIRPDAFLNNRDAILERITEAGFQIALQKEVVLTKEQAEEFYKEHAGQPYYEELTNRMSSGPLLALGLAREDAVSNWRGMLGPTDVEEAKTSAPDSLRAQFAVGDVPINQLHGSDSVEAAQKELNFFFPVEQTVAMIKPDGFGTRDAIIDKIHQAGFRIAAKKETTITREIAESFYEDQKDKEYFNDLVEHMTSGPTMFMVLSRESAVEGWRQEIGPTDPAQAKEQSPDSLRAQFGSDILKNAVHGASSQEEANKKIQTVFGSLDFNTDGTVKEEIQKEPEEEAKAQEAAEQQEQQAEQPQAEQEPEAKAEEQEGQQAEQPAEAEGQAEGEGQSEDKPAEGEGEAAEKTEETEKSEETEKAEKTEEAEKREGEVDEKPSEQTADSEEKDESADHKTECEVDDKTKGEADKKPEDQVEEKTSEPRADSPKGEKPSEPRADSPKGEKKLSEQRADSPKGERKPSEPKADSPKGERKSSEPRADSPKKDEDTGQAAQQKAAEDPGDQENKADDKADDATPEQAAGDKGEEATEQAEAKAEEPKDETPAAEDAKDTKTEEQQEGQAEEKKDEDSKGEQKEGSDETKKEGEEGKTEA